MLALMYGDDEDALMYVEGSLCVSFRGTRANRNH